MSTRRGLSLVEVVMAIVILGLAVPPLLFQLSVGAEQQGAVLIQQNLTQLAGERLWEVFADHADPTRGYGYIVSASYPMETAPRGLAGYARQTTIREVSPTDHVTPQPGSGIKRFQIVVTGPEDHALTVESFVAEIGGAAGPS